MFQWKVSSHYFERNLRNGQLRHLCLIKPAQLEFTLLSRRLLFYRSSQFCTNNPTSLATFWVFWRIWNCSFWGTHNLQNLLCLCETLFESCAQCQLFSIWCIFQRAAGKKHTAAVFGPWATANADRRIAKCICSSFLAYLSKSEREKK